VRIEKRTAKLAHVFNVIDGTHIKVNAMISKPMLLRPVNVIIAIIFISDVVFKGRMYKVLPQKMFRLQRPFAKSLLGKPIRLVSFTRAASHGSDHHHQDDTPSKLHPPEYIKVAQK
jgi:hypothetical protein